MQPERRQPASALRPSQGDRLRAARQLLRRALPRLPKRVPPRLRGAKIIKIEANGYSLAIGSTNLSQQIVLNPLNHFANPPQIETVGFKLTGRTCSACGGALQVIGVRGGRVRDALCEVLSEVPACVDVFFVKQSSLRTTPSTGTLSCPRMSCRPQWTTPTGR